MPFQHSYYCPSYVDKNRLCICNFKPKAVGEPCAPPAPDPYIQPKTSADGELECVGACGEPVVRGWCDNCGTWQDGRAPV